MRAGRPDQQGGRRARRRAAPAVVWLAPLLTWAPASAAPLLEVEAARGAIEVGYRHIDCASVYENEAQIGGVLREVQAAAAAEVGLARHEEAARLMEAAGLESG